MSQASSVPDSVVSHMIWAPSPSIYYNSSTAAFLYCMAVVERWQSLQQYNNDLSLTKKIPQVNPKRKIPLVTKYVNRSYKTILDSSLHVSTNCCSKQVLLCVLSQSE